MVKGLPSKDGVLNRMIKPGDTVAIGQITAEPVTLTEILNRERKKLGGITVFVGMSITESLGSRALDHIRIIGFGGAGTNRRFAGRAGFDALPCHLSDVPHLIADGTIKVDVALIQVAPGDKGEPYSLGLSADYMGDAIAAAPWVVAEVNDRIPWTHGDTAVEPGQIDVQVPTSRPPLELRPAPPGDVERAIADHVARLVPDRATIQMGIGAIPDAVLQALAKKRSLGVHSGLITDGIVDLIEAGAVTNEHKRIDTGATVTALLYGTRRLYDFAHRNPAVQVRSVRHTHDPAVLGQLDRLIAINSALEVDLTGQVNGEVAGGRPLGQIGGQVDFTRAAVRSAGGRAVIALRATARRGRLSGIVPALSGGVTTTPRSDVDVVVTEYGIAELRGRTLRERAEQLIAIAHPDFRKDLEAVAGSLC